jgi:senataxin
MQKNKGKVSDGASSRLREVKDTYNDVDDYISTFEPLLFEEVKAQITQKKDEEESIFLSSFFFLFGSQYIL